MDNKELLNITVITPPLNIVEDFNAHLEESKKPTYNTNCFNGFRRSYLPASDDRVIYFYEFSDIKNCPRKFVKVSDFLAWAKTVDIFISTYTENELKTHPTNYATCYTGSATLMVRHTYDELKTAHENYNRNNPYVSSRYGQYDNEDDYYGGYGDCWD